MITHPFAFTSTRNRSSGESGFLILGAAPVAVSRSDAATRPSRRRLRVRFQKCKTIRLTRSISRIRKPFKVLFILQVEKDGVLFKDAMLKHFGDQLFGLEGAARF